MNMWEVVQLVERTFFNNVRCCITSLETFADPYECEGWIVSNEMTLNV